MKKLLFIFLTFLAVNASAQIPYETSVFWQFLEGFQGGDSTTQNYMEYKNSSLLMRRTGSDVKVFQVKNDVSNAGVLTGFLDEQKNGGFSVDSSDGTTVVKLRGGLDAHTYFMNNYLSIGRAGNTVDYSGTVDGARFTVNDGDRNPFTGLGSADNYQMMVQSSSDLSGEGAGIAFNNENAAKDINVGGAIVYEKLGNNGYGALEFYAKDNTTDLAVPTKYMRMANDTISFLASNIVGINTDNIYTADGTLTGDRTLDLGANTLEFTGGSGAQLRLSDADAVNDYADFEVDASGDLNIEPSGNLIKSTKGIQVINTTNAFKYLEFGISTSNSFAFVDAGGGSSFVPSITVTPSTTFPTYFISNGNTDSGTFPLIRMSARINSGTVTNRTLFDVANVNDPVFSVRTDGISVDNALTSGVGAIIENSDAANTDDIAQFHNSTGTVASITNDGGIVASIPSGTSDTSLVISNDTVYKSVLTDRGASFNYLNNSVNASSTRFTSLTTSSAATSSLTIQTPITGDMTFDKAGIYIRTSQPATGSLVLTLYVNAVASSFIITVPANSSTGFYSSTGSVTVSAGDIVYWQIDNNATSSAGNITVLTTEFQFN